MKIKITVLTVSFLFLVGCVSTNSLNEEKAFIAGYFHSFDHIIHFRNLETKDQINIKFSKGEDLSVESIPPGRWAVIYIVGSSSMQTTYSDIPLHLMTIIEAKSNTITFLGDFSYQMDDRAFFDIRQYSEGKATPSYPFQRFERELIDNYEIPENMDVLPLKFLSIN